MPAGTILWIKWGRGAVARDYRLYFTKGGAPRAMPNHAEAHGGGYFGWTDLFYEDGGPCFTEIGLDRPPGGQSFRDVEI